MPCDMVLAKLDILTEKAITHGLWHNGKEVVDFGYKRVLWNMRAGEETYLFASEVYDQVTNVEEANAKAFVFI